MKKIGVLVVVLSFLVTNQGCKMSYGFNDASIDYTKVKTISISVFPNYAPLAQPTLSQEFTEALRDIFLVQTRLDLVKTDGDLQFSGKITGYSTAPVGIQADEIAAQNRLTITVQVKFVNKSDESKNYESSFTQYADYDSNKPLNEVESELVKEINELLTQQIFNKAVSNW
ncbi:MAG: hypothetical protein CL840_10605 [Crocinitomicaceae bacterium]|nr:hypothetical protein [Crocinitomicaceae bacterium]|tara:strand:- start:4767 stop:5279 length:513 start_codon:yes stop_codon:yes gene_type:complete